MSTTQSSYDTKTTSIINRAGYHQAIKIAKTLQGTVWRAVHKSSNKQIVIKVSNKNLTDKQMIIINNTKYNVHENIIKEKKILQYLTKDKECPQSIIKYVDYFKRYIQTPYLQQQQTETTVRNKIYPST